MERFAKSSALAFMARRRRNSRSRGSSSLQSNNMSSISLRLRRSLDSLRSKPYEAAESSAASMSSSKSSLSSKTSKSMKKAGHKLKTLPGRIRRRASSALDNTGPENLPTTLSFITEEEDPLPDLDRDFDLNVTLTGFTLQQDLDAALENILIPAMAREDQNYPTQKLDPRGPSFLWFKIPISCRGIIYKLLFPATEKKILLSARQFTQAVFPDWCFLSPWDVLDEVWGPLESCSAWRKEILAFFWSQYHFHITLNEFTMKFTSPLSHGWVYPYLDTIQRLTIERDFTRLASSHHKGAAGLSFVISKKVTIMLSVLIAGLLKRDSLPMAELHFMGRKYAGFRPADHVPDSLGPVRYVPTYVEETCAGISKLESILARFRMSGFSHEFTKSTMQTMFKSKTFYKEYKAPIESPWPSLAPNHAVNFFLLAALRFPPLEPALERSEEQADRMQEYAVQPSPDAKNEENTTSLAYATSLEEHACASPASAGPLRTQDTSPSADSHPPVPESIEPMANQTEASRSDTQPASPRPDREGGRNEKEDSVAVASITSGSGQQISRDEKTSYPDARTPTITKSHQVSRQKVFMNPASGLHIGPRNPSQELSRMGTKKFASDVERAMIGSLHVVRYPSPHVVRTSGSSFVSDEMTYVDVDEKSVTGTRHNSAAFRDEVQPSEYPSHSKNDTSKPEVAVVDYVSADKGTSLKSIGGDNRYTSQCSSSGDLGVAIKNLKSVENGYSKKPAAPNAKAGDNRNNLKRLVDFPKSSGQPDKNYAPVRPPSSSSSPSSDTSKGSNVIIGQSSLKIVPTTCKSSDVSGGNGTPERTPKVSTLINKFSNGNTQSNTPKLNAPKLRTPKLSSPNDNALSSRIPLPNRIKSPSTAFGANRGEVLAKPFSISSKFIEDQDKDLATTRELKSSGPSSRANTQDVAKNYNTTAGASYEGASKLMLPKGRRLAEQLMNNSSSAGPPRAGSLAERSQTPDSQTNDIGLVGTRRGGVSKALPKHSGLIEQPTSSQTTSRLANNGTPPVGSKILKYTKIPHPVTTSGRTMKPSPNAPNTKVKSPNSSDEFREQFPEFSPTFMSSNTLAARTGPSRSVSPIFEKEKYEAMLTKMEQMNENDEAFQRTMDALQALNDEDKHANPRGRSTRIRSGPSTPSPGTHQPINGDDGTKAAGRTFFSSFSFKRT